MPTQSRQRVYLATRSSTFQHLCVPSWNIKTFLHGSKSHNSNNTWCFLLLTNIFTLTTTFGSVWCKISLQETDLYQVNYRSQTLCLQNVTVLHIMWWYLHEVSINTTYTPTNDCSVKAIAKAKLIESRNNLILAKNTLTSTRNWSERLTRAKHGNAMQIFNVITCACLL